MRKSRERRQARRKGKWVEAQSAASTDLAVDF
jgi:hypothetical protein